MTPHAAFCVLVPLWPLPTTCVFWIPIHGILLPPHGLPFPQVTVPLPFSTWCHHYLSVGCYLMPGSFLPFCYTCPTPCSTVRPCVLFPCGSACIPFTTALNALHCSYLCSSFFGWVLFNPCYCLTLLLFCLPYSTLWLYILLHYLLWCSRLLPLVPSYYVTTLFIVRCYLVTATLPLITFRFITFTSLFTVWIDVLVYPFLLFIYLHYVVLRIHTFPYVTLTITYSTGAITLPLTLFLLHSHCWFVLFHTVTIAIYRFTLLPRFVYYSRTPTFMPWFHCVIMCLICSCPVLNLTPSALLILVIGLLWYFVTYHIHSRLLPSRSWNLPYPVPYATLLLLAITHITTPSILLFCYSLFSICLIVAGTFLTFCLLLGTDIAIVPVTLRLTIESTHCLRATYPYRGFVICCLRFDHSACLTIYGRIIRCGIWLFAIVVAICRICPTGGGRYVLRVPFILLLVACVGFWLHLLRCLLHYYRLRAGNRIHASIRCVIPAFYRG